jgi:eukaryotic-like serine/threonine-protein kinase
VVTLSPELTLRGRYRPVQRVAVGGMGEVWQAEDTLLGRTVAIKMVRPEYSDDASFRDRFRNEARHAAVLTHPNVTQVFDFDEGGDGDDALPYIVMEFVDGKPLAEVLAEKGRLSDQQTWSVLGQTAAALGAAHAVGVVHRDVKAGNILVCSDGRVKVTDFGIARAVDEAGTTQTGFLMGTASYLAPELLRGEPASPASDMYALGVVAYECITGRAPFTGELADVIDAQQRDQVPPLPDTVTPALGDLVMALLAKDPAARPADAAAVAAQAHRFDGMSSLSGSRLLSDPYPRESAAAQTPTGPIGLETQVFDDGVVPALVGGLSEAPASPSYGGDARTGPRRGLLIALGCLVTVALVAAAVLLTIRAVGGGRSSAKPSQSSSPAKSPQPIKVAQATVYAPDGGSADHPEELPLATDASTSSAWFTEHYASANFGSLKPGLGLLVSVPARSSVRMLTVRFATPGVAAKVFAGDNPSSLLQSKPVATTGGAPATWRVQPDRPVQAKYWLVWITRLVPNDGGYRAGVADLRFT